MTRQFRSAQTTMAQAMAAPLLTTKLYMPPFRLESVSRPRLIARLDAGLGHKLTLISAPAGFGKTTLLVEWLSAKAGRTLPPHTEDGAGQEGDAPLSTPRASWLSLDEEDNDPARFFTYLIAALERIQPGVGAEARGLLESLQPPPPRLMLTLLINGLAAAADRFVLVLDDYHVIEQRAIHDALTFLIEHQPLQMHLVLAGRADPPLPLARLRTRGQMTEIRAVDLRFTPYEAAAFLNGAMGLGLCAEDIEALEARTEGWISGLQLAALSMRGQAAEHRADFIAAFGGSHRHVIDYLAEEVLAGQPPEIADFLCQTALLNRLTGPLCDAVTGRQDSDGVLEELERANLFLVPLDGERRWYRYHRLFADFVRNRLLAEYPDRVHDLHCWAADWYERNGFLAEAVGHVLEAGEREWACRLVGQTAIETLMRGQVATVLGWLKALPDGAVRARPQLCVAYAAALTVAGRLEDVEAYLQEAERGVQDREPGSVKKAVLSRVAVIRAYLATLQGDLDRAMALAQEAAEPLAADDVFFRGIVSWLQGMTEYFAQGAAAAGRKFAETARLSREAGSTLLTLLSIYASGFLRMLQGQLHRARETFAEGLLLAETEAQRPGLGWTQQPSLGASLMYQGLGEVSREQGDLERAEQYLARSVELGKQWGNAETLADSYAFYARIKHARGDVSGAHEIMDKAEQLGQEGRIAPLTVRQIRAHRARLWIADDRLGAAARWADECRRNRAADRDAGGQIVLYVQGLEDRVRAQYCLALGQFEQAIALLTPHQAALEASGWTGLIIETLALQALALAGQGRTDEALELLSRALSLAEPEGFVRVFVDQGQPMCALLLTFHDRESSSGALQVYVDRLLSVLAPSKAEMPESQPLERGLAAKPETVLPEPLTLREREVLRLVVAGLTNREIAQQLTIAVGTAKRHVSNIYAKLDVHSRVQAVARARALHLT
jgi:LuxR family maltose regulon positive regulatory protein